MDIKASGVEPGRRQLNGVQTTGRDYRALSEVEFSIRRTNDVEIVVRDGVTLLADLFQPDAEGRFPALLSFSCYPRQIQDVGAPIGFVEAGASDFFTPRGYAHLIANARGTGGSGGVTSFLDQQEREDLFDVIAWIAAQPWCDGNVGMLGISYFAMAQLAAAVEQPPALKAIFPVAVTDDLYGAVWHNGLLNSSFISAWLPAVGVMAAKSNAFWRGARIDIARHIFNMSAIHERLQHLNGEAIVSVLMALKGAMIRAHYEEEPYGRLWREMAVEHPTHDAFWHERDTRARLGVVEIPVHLGCDWDNAPLHLPCTFGAWKALKHNPNVRMDLLAPGGLTWPWESLHYEALAWYDHWLKGRDTGIMDGPPIRYVIPGADGWRACSTWPPPESALTAFALCADGTLAEQEGEAGTRSYLHMPADSGSPANANPPDLPSSLEWDTKPMLADFDFAGNIELQLDATITALDTGWIAVLYDVAPGSEPEAVTAGWLRASMSHVNEEDSAPGAPVLDCREPIAIAVGKRNTYRIPVVPNARRIAAGHRLRIVLASADEQGKTPTILGLTHTTVREASVNTIHSSSRLLLPVLPA
jgi:putative CocE/NonD family hydrolase